MTGEGEEAEMMTLTQSLRREREERNPLVKIHHLIEVEEGRNFQPKFDENGLIPVITIDYEDNQVLMHGYMNEEALKASIKT